MRGLGHVSPLFVVLFIEALVFLALVRRGVYIPLGAGIACVFVVVAHIGPLILREEKRQDIHWVQALLVRQWSSENRRGLSRAVFVALLFALVMIVAAHFFDKL